MCKKMTPVAKKNDIRCNNKKDTPRIKKIIVFLFE